LCAQEGTPTGVSLAGRGSDAGGEDAPDRARADAMAEPGEFSLDAAMPPAKVLLSQLDD
jgi:hypothetical protein